MIMIVFDNSYNITDITISDYSHSIILAIPISKSMDYSCNCTLTLYTGTPVIAWGKFYNHTLLLVLINTSHNILRLWQATSLGSGSHSPFPMHVDELGPVSTSPEEQVKLTLSPSRATVGIE